MVSHLKFQGTESRNKSHDDTDQLRNAASASELRVAGDAAAGAPTEVQ